MYSIVMHTGISIAKGSTKLYHTLNSIIDCLMQVVSMSRGLDRCAALLKSLLSPEKQGTVNSYYLHVCVHVLMTLYLLHMHNTCTCICTCMFMCFT